MKTARLRTVRALSARAARSSQPWIFAFTTSLARRRTAS
jgi:hypothetical protein